MKNTALFIIGGLAVVGAGFYFFIRKKPVETTLETTPANTTNNNTPSSGSASGSTAVGSNVNTVIDSNGNLSGSTSGQSGSGSSQQTSPSDANINLANATVLVGQRAILVAKIKAPLPSTGFSIGGWGTSQSEAEKARTRAIVAREVAKKELVELDKKLAILGYKVDANGSLVRI
jgi:LPXTG-motif cell wall-anchored protein